MDEIACLKLAELIEADPEWFQSDSFDDDALAQVLRQVANLKKLRKALEFYRDEWQQNGDGDTETPGLSRTWLEPTDKLMEDEGRQAREALAGRMTGAEMREIRERLGLSLAGLANLLQFTGSRNTVEKKIRKMEDGRENIGQLTESILRDLALNGLPARPQP